MERGETRINSTKGITMKILLTLLLVVFLVAVNTVYATDTPKPKPAPIVQQSSSSNAKDENYAYASILVSGLATAALRDKPNGGYMAFAGTVAAAAAVNAAHSGSFNNENFWYAVGGAAVGTIGTCAVYFKKGFVGCGFEFK
jgi:hypothetical protein